MKHDHAKTKPYRVLIQFGGVEINMHPVCAESYEIARAEADQVLRLYVSERQPPQASTK